MLNSGSGMQALDSILNPHTSVESCTTATLSTRCRSPNKIRGERDTGFET